MESPEKRRRSALPAAAGVIVMNLVGLEKWIKHIHERMVDDPFVEGCGANRAVFRIVQNKVFVAAELERSIAERSSHALEVTFKAGPEGKHIRILRFSPYRSAMRA